MANSTISLSFKITEGANSLKQLTVDAEGLKKVMEANVTEVDKFNKACVNFSALAKSVNAISETLRQLEGALSDLSNAYAAQQTVETQLEVVMRNNMAATEDEILSIKKLCSAQQELGVVGDEVQLAGAQKLAVFVKEKGSLEALIPAMNDYLVGQYGLNVSQQQAATLAEAFGKALRGQTRSLEAHCGELTETQKKIFELGTEQQKVAMLTEIVSSKYGGMNAALKATSSGGIQGLNNTIGDIKETLGAFAQYALPIVSIGASATIAVAGVVKLVQGFAVLRTALLSTSRALGLTAAFSGSTTQVFSRMTVAVKALSAGHRSAAISAAILKGAIRSLMIATGVGIAIWALTEVVNAFASSSDKAANSANDLADAEAQIASEQEAQVRAANEANSSMEIYISKIKNFSGTKAQEKKLIDELNSTYGDTMGYYKDLNGWYVALTQNASNYVELLKEQMNAQKYAQDLIRLREQRDSESIDTKNLVYDEKGTNYIRNKAENQKGKVNGKSISTADDYVALIDTVTGERRVMKKQEWHKIENRRTTIDWDISTAQAGLDASTARMNSLAKSVHTGADQPYTTTHTSTPTKKPQLREDATQLKDIEENVAYYREQLKTATIETAAETNQNIAKWEEIAKAIREAGKEAEKPKVLEVIADPQTIDDLRHNIDALTQKKAKIEISDEGTIKKINKDIEEAQQKIERLENLGKTKTDTGAPVLNSNATTLKDIEGNISYWQEQLNGANVAEAAAINSEIAMWQKKADAIRNAGKEAKVTFENFRSGWSSIKGVGSGVESITKALEGNGNAWQTLTGIVDGFFQIYDGISGIVELIQMLTAATRASSMAKTEENVNTAVGIGLKSAETEVSQQNMLVKQGEAIANATSSGAKLPFPANVAAIAAGIAAVVSAFAMIGSFATGGIVGGNSPSGDRLLARVNSGEMILNKEQQRNLFNQLNAPLRMASVAAPAAISAPAINADAIMANRREEMKFPKIISRISGRDIVLSAANETRIASKSGRKSNIVI